MTGLLGGETGTESASATTADRTAQGRYVCRGCDRRFDLEYHVCPECGGYRVEAEFDPI
jgi:rRNA maturation endonuclease Nob1